MNDLQVSQENHGVSVRPDSWMNGDTLTHLCRLAEMMASSKVTVPRHLAGNVGDCLAVSMQAMQWGMNPYAVAQKTHIVHGNLGYEGQLVNAVVTSIAPTEDRLEFEFFGPWENVIGKFNVVDGPNGKYTKPSWSEKDEDGIGVKVYATMKGESKPRSIDVLLKQCWPRNSTQWATDPQQQITYVAVKKWARRYCPDVILGVYTPDELEPVDSRPTERDVTPEKQPSIYSQEDFDKNFPKWKEKIELGTNTPERIIAMVEAKGSLTEEMKQRLFEIKAGE
ncbi:RecT family recombinase [Vibrio metschnikovii]|uniref:RecT family recombinase n=1 Tax=Vibrio metschnikovii TaxID=28172 RepID=UPI001C2F9E9D|nr:RecT family recombinase [Vibrio metschnikovii]